MRLDLMMQRRSDREKQRAEYGRRIQQFGSATLAAPAAYFAANAAVERSALFLVIVTLQAFLLLLVSYNVLNLVLTDRGQSPAGKSDNKITSAYLADRSVAGSFFFLALFPMLFLAWRVDASWCVALSLPALLVLASFLNYCEAARLKYEHLTNKREGLKRIAVHLSPLLVAVAASVFLAAHTTRDFDPFSRSDSWKVASEDMAENAAHKIRGDFMKRGLRLPSVLPGPEGLRIAGAYYPDPDRLKPLKKLYLLFLSSDGKDLTVLACDPESGGKVFEDAVCTPKIDHRAWESREPIPCVPILDAATLCRR